MSVLISLKVSSVLVLTYIIPILEPTISIGLMCFGSGQGAHCGGG